MFHDFLGAKVPPTTTDSPVVLGHKGGGDVEASPSASASIGGASSGGGRPPLSTTSDLGSSERQHGNHLEGIPYYGPRGDLSALEISTRISGSKRSNSDSAFVSSTRDGIPRMKHDSLESLHLMKMLKNGGGGERSRRSHDDEGYYSMQPMRPASGTLILHPSAGGRHDTNASKWERSIPMGASMQYAPRGNQFVPFTQQIAANRFKDTNAGSSLMSQAAADEGSRTGMKGPGILSSISAADKNASAMIPSSSKPKTGTRITEPETSTPLSRPNLATSSRQMTIFYGGQAHVFDDVHPNKADVIMALAGSNGGSWSTTYSTKPMTRTNGEGQMAARDYEAGAMTANSQLHRELSSRRRSIAAATAAQGIGSSHHIATTSAMNMVKAGEQPSCEDKRLSQ